MKPIVFIIILMSMAFKLFGQQSKEKKFWEWFEKNESTYYQDVGNTEIEEALYSELNIQLNKVSDGLTFEFSPIHENGVRELSISAEGIQEFFPDVIALIESAPAIANWQFNAFRQRIPGDNYVINIGELSIGYSDLYFRYGHDGDKIGIELNIKHYDDQPQTKNAIYILLDGVIGEYDVTTSISWIEWVVLDEENIANLNPIIKLREVVDEKKKSLKK